MNKKRPLRYNNKEVILTKKDQKINEIKEICGKFPKIEEKIKHIKNLDKLYYYAKVWYISESQPLFLLEGFDQRNFKGYHLDHIIPISYGFLNKIPPSVIGNIKNLRFIPWKDNYAKGCSVNPSDLKRIKYKK